MKLIKEFDDIEDWFVNASGEKGLDIKTQKLLERVQHQKQEAFHAFESFKKKEYEAQKELMSIKNK